MPRINVDTANIIREAALKKLDEIGFRASNWQYCHGGGVLETEGNPKFVFHLRTDIPNKKLRDFKKLKNHKIMWENGDEIGEAEFDFELREVAVAGGPSYLSLIWNKITYPYKCFRRRMEALLEFEPWLHYTVNFLGIVMVCVAVGILAVFLPNVPTWLLLLSAGLSITGLAIISYSQEK